ncbi:polyprenyl synthetase family protein, partial [Streptomyces sp. NPDC048845]|uniref:polyprenyl synthetase family protein n=1 Tax=Streptomyces sp. NPDC048845 TaxID=3155390 RepID=UPI00342495B7
MRHLPSTGAPGPAGSRDRRTPVRTAGRPPRAPEPAATERVPGFAVHEREPESAADEDLTAAVEHTLTRYLGERREEAARSSDRFAADVVEPFCRFVLGGGKRLRPAFVWWGWRAAGGRPGDAGRVRAVLRAAAAVELLQASALVHDDLMDGSALRRNEPAAHVRLAARHRAAGLRGNAETFGLHTAVLTGDLALAWADDLWESAPAQGETGSRAREVWHAMRTEMVAGQYLDLYHQAEENDSAAAALRVARLKSALYTVERPLHLGAALAGGSGPATAALRRAGGRIGLAFQLRDDLLSVFGSQADTGKPAGDDLREGKRTYLMAVALRRARAQGRADAERQLRDVLRAPGLTPAGLARIRVVLA